MVANVSSEKGAYEAWRGEGEGISAVPNKSDRVFSLSLPAVFAASFERLQPLHAFDFEVHILFMSYGDQHVCTFTLKYVVRPLTPSSFFVLENKRGLHGQTRTDGFTFLLLLSAKFLPTANCLVNAIQRTKTAALYSSVLQHSFRKT